MEFKYKKANAYEKLSLHDAVIKEVNINCKRLDIVFMENMGIEIEAEKRAKNSMLSIDLNHEGEIVVFLSKEYRYKRETLYKSKEISFDEFRAMIKLYGAEIVDEFYAYNTAIYRGEIMDKNRKTFFEMEVFGGRKLNIEYYYDDFNS